MLTAFLLKPDGHLHRDHIERRLSFEGQVPLFHEIELSVGDINAMYGKVNVGPEVMLALREYLSERPCILGQFDGSVDHLLDVSGRYTDPERCAENTIRRMYGGGVGLTVSGIPVIRNAIHRPKNLRQNEDLLRIIDSIKER